jgi:hypothetical protein
MTRAGRGWAPGALVLFALLLFAWSHRHAPAIAAFADDVGLLIDFPQRASAHTLVADVMARVAGPLWPGSTMWRPLPYASFAFDAVLWGGASAGDWRLTNLMLHIGCATLVGLIAARLTHATMAGAAAFSLFLLMPWVPEVSIWLVGRFDGWATLWMLAATWSALRSAGLDRWAAASVLAGICAYASKESALILPAWIVLVAMADVVADRTSGGDRRRDVRTDGARVSMGGRWVVIAAHLALAGAYALWRAHLFADASVNAYAGAKPEDLAQFLSRLVAHAGFAGGLVALSPVAAWVAGVCSLALLAQAACSDARTLAATGGLMACAVFAALAMYFADAPGAGEGYRLDYMATVGMVLILAAGVSRAGRIHLIVLLVAVVALAQWQSRVVAEWTRATRDMRDVQVALLTEARRLPSTDYGLVLLPDMMGHVPFARNAQGAIALAATAQQPGADVLSKLIVFTPPQLAEWHRLAQQDIVRKITSRGDAPSRPTRYFCFRTGDQQLQDLGVWPPGDYEQWAGKWRDSVSSQCPNLKL